MKTSSCKAKGRNAQKAVRDLLLKYATNSLTENDVRSTSMGSSGVDILLSEAALLEFPFAIEVKCQEALNIWSALEQAEENAGAGVVPVLCFKRNRTDLYVALSLEDFLAINSERLVKGPVFRK